MRTQMDLTADGRDLGTVRWRETPRSIELADRVARRLHEEGIPARVDRDEAEPGEMYREVLVGEYPVDLAVCILEEGAFLSADGPDEDEQAEWRALLVTLRIVEEECGWKASEEKREWALSSALEQGVGPDGVVVRPARISRAELEERVYALVKDARELLRPEEMRRGPALVEMEEALSPLMGGVKAAVTLTWSPNSAGMSGGGELRESARDAVVDLLFETDTAEKVYTELSHPKTGRVLRLRATSDGVGGVTLQPEFDTLDVSHGFVGSGWEHVVAEMLQRDPQWRPAWVGEAVALLEEGGKRVPRV